MQSTTSFKPFQQNQPHLADSYSLVTNFTKLELSLLQQLSDHNRKQENDRKLRPEVRKPAKKPSMRTHFAAVSPLPCLPCCVGMQRESETGPDPESQANKIRNGIRSHWDFGNVEHSNFLSPCSVRERGKKTRNCYKYSHQIFSDYVKIANLFCKRHSLRQ